MANPEEPVEADTAAPDVPENSGEPIVLQELPTKVNRRELEKRLKDLLGPPPQEPVKIEDEPPEDNQTAAAVDEIVAVESDVVLAAEDKELDAAFSPQKPGFRAVLGRFFKRWWGSRLWRNLTLACIGLLLVGAAAWPTSRYIILNFAGARGGLSLTVLDEASQQPLKNVRVSIADSSGVTADNGTVNLRGVKLGKNVLELQKRAYATTQKSMVLGWGSNPLGAFSLKAVGGQYTILVKDLLSGKPIEEAQATSGEANAAADKNGKILLAIEASEAKTAKVTILAKGYRDEIFELNLGVKADQNVKMVTNRKVVFVSKQSGKFDVYSAHIDGKNEEVVVKGTGIEQSPITLASHPTDEIAVLVSTRDNIRNAHGFLLSTLTLIDLDEKKTTNVAQSERIQIEGWVGDKLIYVQIAAGSSEASLKRYRLIAYDYKTGDKRELASANYFNGVSVASATIYFAQSNIYGNDPGIGLYKILADGSSKRTITNDQVWNISRTGYENFSLAIGNDWYDYPLTAAKPNKLDGEPADLRNRIYTDNAAKNSSLWVDKRDGKGVLLAYNPATKTDKILKTQSGISYPVRWLNDKTALYRIYTDQETADYVISTDGGEALKVRDVTNTNGPDSGPYY